MHSTVVAADQNRRREFLFACAVALVALIFQVGSLRNHLGDVPSGQREFVTAISIRTLTQDGLQLNYPVPVIGFPWHLPGEFGLYQNLSALTALVTGQTPESAGRMISAAFFYLALPAVFLLGRQFGGKSAIGLLAIAWWLLGPLGLHRAATLSSAMTAFALSAWWLWCVWQSLLAPTVRNRLAAALLGTLAALTGPFTFASFALLSFGLAWSHRATPTWKATLAWALAPALVAALVWSWHAHHLMALSPYGAQAELHPTWASAVGSLASRGSAEFWLNAVDIVFGTIIPAITILLLLVFASANPSSATPRLSRRFLLVALIALLGLLPFYTQSLAEVSLVSLVVALVVGQALGGVLSFRGPVEFRSLLLAAVVVATSWFIAEAPAKKKEPQNEIETRMLAEALALATRPTDIIITIGGDTDPRFSYYAQRRTIAVPTGMETDLDALDRAIGPGHDLTIGAVVLTGRFRSETDYLERLQKKFHLAANDVLSNGPSNVYVREGTRDQLVESLKDTNYRGLISREPGTLEVPAPPAVPAASPDPAAPLPVTEIPRATTVADNLPILPLKILPPTRYSIPYDFALHTMADELCFFAHAPTALEFDLKGPATTINLGYFMGPGSYTGKGNTDGVEVIVQVLTTEGKRTELLHHALKPNSNPFDRDVKSASLSFTGKLGDTVIVYVSPGPEGRANFDWVYFRLIQIF